MKPRRKMPTCFNPRSPRGGATVGDAYVWGAQGVSIHAPHEGERLKLINDLSDQICVSIHAPHEGERLKKSVGGWGDALCFNPRSPRGGATRIVKLYRQLDAFQSTLPTRGSDDQIRRRYKAAESFNPRSPRGGATWSTAWLKAGTGFQSTLPTRGSDLSVVFFGLNFSTFQSTLPTRGSDACSNRPLFSSACFNPRSPRGGATSSAAFIASYRSVSIHAPHEGERPSGTHATRLRVWIVSIHAPHEGERLRRAATYVHGLGVSIHAPHEGERRSLASHSSSISAVSIHAPHEGERRRKSAFVCSISANLLNIIHCGTVTRAVSRRRIALFRLFSVRRSGVFMYAYASH